MNIIFFEDKRDEFLPLVYTKPLAKIRVGILTIEGKWQKQFEQHNVATTISYITEAYLSDKYSVIEKAENIFINARFFPNERLVKFIINNLLKCNKYYNKDRYDQ